MNRTRPLALAVAAAAPVAAETGQSGQKARSDSEVARVRQRPADLRREALRLQEEGYSVREIAGRLGRSKSTVADYLRRPAPPVPVPLSLVEVGPETEADRIKREQREAAEHPAVRDPELLRGRLIVYAYRVLRQLEERIDEACYRDLVGGMKMGVHPQ
jgi:predicted transcriptional regulator